MKENKNISGCAVWDLEEDDIVRLPIEKGVYLTVRKIGPCLDIRTVPGLLRITPVNTMRVFVGTNHADLKGLFDEEGS